jgi:deazaflavin-dependent oxidoreductase (nitroreductase family)
MGVRDQVIKVASSRAGAWFFINVSAKLDPPLLKASKGWVSSLPGQPVLLLAHTGAKSGARRETPLVYASDGPDLVLIASNGGNPKHPAWYHNLIANPECEVVARGRSGRYLAREAAGPERERLWARALEIYPGYATYQARTDGRTIPVLILHRA